MKRFLFTITIALLAACMTQVNGQDLKRFIKNRKDNAKETAVERTGREADKGISKRVNKELDKLFGKEEENTPDTTSNAEYDNGEPDDSGNDAAPSSAAGIGANTLMRGMGMNTNVHFKDKYVFDAFVEMNITSYDKDGKEDESGIYKTYIDSHSLDYGMEFRDKDDPGKSTIIFDTQDSLMLTLMDSDGEKTGIAMKFTPDQSEAISEAQENEDNEGTDNYEAYNIKKTGKTKKIMGYTCEEYQTEDESSITSIWVTKELGKKLDKTFLRNSNFAGTFFYAYYMDGFVMEYVIQEKDSKEKTVMTVIDLDVDKSSTISTSGYRIMSMGEMMK